MDDKKKLLEEWKEINSKDSYSMIVRDIVIEMLRLSTGLIVNNYDCLLDEAINNVPFADRISGAQSSMSKSCFIQFKEMGL